MLSFLDKKPYRKGLEMSNKELLTFDKSDFIASKVALVVGVAAVAIVTVGLTVYDWLAGRAIRVSVPVGEEASVGGVKGVVEQMLVELATPTGADRAILLGVGVLLTLLVTGGAALLWGFLSAASKGNMFTADNVARLRGLALLMVTAPIFWITAEGFVNAHFIRRVLDQPSEETLWAISGHVGVPVLIMAAGMLLALVAEAFKKGLKLEDDVAGLI